MSRTFLSPRQRASRCSPRLEPLESRRLFTASDPSGVILPGTFAIPSDSSLGASSLLSVSSVDPAPGSVVTSSPSALTITFNQPFDPSSVGNDIALEQVAADGTVTPVDGSLLSEPFDLSAPTASLVVTLDGGLAPGDYRIVLLGASTLVAAHAPGSPAAPLANSGSDQVLGDFKVGTQGVTLGGATDLGTVGPTQSVVSGSLDLQANPGAVALYKFTLAPGHFWRLGAEVSAGRDGGTLGSSLALFDAQGQVLATDTLGRPDDPSDPFLFHGLAPGTYYVGVSGQGNLPGVPGGYDPVSGLPGTVGQGQPGGPFRLHLEADTADSPTRLLGASLNRADPSSTTPTGVTLTFSGPMDTSTFLDSVLAPAPGESAGRDVFQGLEVVDQSGKVVTMTLIGYQETASRFTFLFDQPLSPGHYSLEVPTQGGITDLAGLHPVAAGEPAGILATWDVTQGRSPADPHNLGTLLGDSVAGIPGSDVVPAGTASTYRFVVAVEGLYDVATIHSGGSLSIRRIGPGGVVTTDPGAAGLYETNLMELRPGVYDLQFIASGTQSVDVNWTLSYKKGLAESILSNGVGQGPALNLTLIAPSAPGVVGASLVLGVPSGPQPFSIASTPSNPGVSAPPAPPTLAGTSSTATAPGLVLTIGSSLVGTASAQLLHVAAVGPGTTSGTTALASAGPGVPQGITYGPTRTSTPGQAPDRDGTGAASGDDLASIAPSPPTDGALVAKSDPAAPDLDERVLDVADWLGGMGPALARWFDATPGVDGSAEADASAERIALEWDDVSEPSKVEVEHADLAMPLGVGVFAILATRIRQPVRRWLRRKAARATARGQSPWASGRGPHNRA